MAIVAHSIPSPVDKPAKIYAETPNINYFVGSLAPDVEAGPTNISVTSAGGSRSQYPGDSSPIQQGGSTRRVLVDPSRKSGNAIPGRSFILVAKDEQGNDLEKRRFSYTGAWIDVHAYLRGACSGNVFAYNSSGARYTISVAE